MRQRMFSLFFHARRGETGAGWALMNHISIIEKKHWKRKSDIKPQTEGVICFGGWRSVSHVCRWTLCHPALSLPTDTLSDTKTRVLLSTQSFLSRYNSSSVYLASHCPPFLHKLASSSVQQQKQKADEEVNGSLCVLTTRKWHHVWTIDEVKGADTNCFALLWAPSGY